MAFCLLAMTFTLMSCNHKNGASEKNDASEKVLTGNIVDVLAKDIYPGEVTIKDGKITLDGGYIPVVSTVACDENGNIYNINGDTAAAHIAGALEAERLIMMTDIAGILRDKDDPSTLIPKIYVSEAPQLIAEGIISGGMIPKIECCIEAIRRGVKKVFVIDGRIPHAILIETLTDEGIGTMFVTGDSYNDYQRN